MTIVKDATLGVLSDPPKAFTVYRLSDVVLYSHDNEVLTTSATYTKVKTITINALNPSPSVLRIYFEFKSPNGSGFPLYAKICKNGADLGIEQITSSTSYISRTEDLTFSLNNTIELWAKIPTGANGYLRFFRVLGDVPACAMTGFIGSNS